MSTADHIAREPGGGDGELAKELAALGHPLRLAILRAACRPRSHATSAVEASRMLRETLTLVSYHARILREAGLLVTVELIPRRGAVERRLAPTARARALLSALDYLELINARQPGSPDRCRSASDHYD